MINFNLVNLFLVYFLPNFFLYLHFYNLKYMQTLVSHFHLLMKELNGQEIIKMNNNMKMKNKILKSRIKINILLMPISTNQNHLMNSIK